MAPAKKATREGGGRTPQGAPAAPARSERAPAAKPRVEPRLRRRPRPSRAGAASDTELRMHETLVGHAGGRPAPRRARAGNTSTASSRRPRPLKFGTVGLGAEPAEVHTVHYKDIAAVISDTPIEVPDATRENVLAHERVNENVMRTHTVIPMSFGTVFKTPRDIVELLRGAYDAFNDVLDKMEDKLEFGLKLLWDRDVAMREVEKEDEEVRG